ncbi:RNA polymerase sigma factor [Bacillus phage P59]|nr:RNA polymerase sigma factor [Bacillus phage P59]
MARTATKKLLSHEETMELINAAHSGDESARDTLVMKNERLVWSTVQRFINRGYEPEDLFQIGCIGLLKAIDKFNTDFDVKFSTYAVPMIIGEIQRFIRDDGIVKTSRSIKELANKIRRGELIDKPIHIIMEALEVTEEEQVKTALEYIRSSVRSMDSVVYENDGDPITLGDQLAGDVNSLSGSWFDNIALHAALDHLDEREKKIVQLRYFVDRTQSEVAEVLGISQVQVSRLEKGILLKIKELYQSEEEKDMPQAAAGNREEAIKLLKETEMTNKEISESTGVPLGSMGHLAKQHRPQEITDRIKERTAAKLKEKKSTDSRRKAKKTEGTVVKGNDHLSYHAGGTTTGRMSTATPNTSAEPKSADTVTIASLVDTEPPKKASVFELAQTSKEIGSARVEFNFNLNMSGVAVDKEEVLAKMEEATNLLKFVNTDKVSFRFNVGS